MQSMQSVSFEESEYSPEQIEHYARQMDEKGYFIVEDVLSPAELAQARSALDEIFEREADIGVERGWRTQTHMVSYMLPQKHPFFRRLPLHPKILPLMRRILGPRCVMSSMNGFTMSPGGENQPLHLDQSESVPGTVLTINAMLALDDFTVANGATRVIPGSQNRIFDRTADRSALEAETVRLIAPSGSLIAFNGGLWHAGSSNTTEKYRRTLHAFYMRPWVKPQWDFNYSLSPDVIESLTKEERRIYGIGHIVKWYDSRIDDVSYSSSPDSESKS